MTTKFKIIAGFGIMILLLCGLSTVGYMGVQSASEGMTTYRRHAQLDTMTSDMSVALSNMSLNLLRFIKDKKTADTDAGLLQIETFKKLGDTAVSTTRVESRTLAFKSLRAEAEPIIDLYSRASDGVLHLGKVFAEKIRPAYRSMFVTLETISDAALELNNDELAHATAGLWKTTAFVMVALGRFNENFSMKDGLLAKERIDDMQKNIDQMLVTLKTNEGRKIIDDFIESYTLLRDSCNAMLQEAVAINASLESLRKSVSDINDSMSSLSKVLGAEARAEAVRTLENNENTKKSMLITSAAGAIFGAILALFIIRGIVITLNALARFSNAIAQGNFDQPINSREKGEIGIMVTAIRTIPNILQNIIATTENLSHDIQLGRLRNRLNPAEFNGSFANLALAVNTVSDSYTSVLDQIPVPLMTCDKNLTIDFLNKAAQSMMGGDHVNAPCRDHLRADICGTDKCLGKRCMQNGGAVTDETAMTPHDRKLDTTMTAIPLVDRHGAAVASIEVITDLTEIKSQQQAMRTVADEASELSNRIAAASEELSAQVEEVSRGAEMQRVRVESTATAMNEMNSTVIEVARNAGQASEQSNLTRARADEGANLVNEVVKSINTVNSVATSLQNNMQELGAQAESIGGVMNVISDIADQTNLLALNAAIEAARAGDAGRGFAVVADEVRKLAEKTMSATQEVGANIAAVQNSAHTNIDEVGNAVKNITEATQLANSSGEALNGILELASASSAIVSSIATAAEEQSATSEEINRAIVEINQVVGETTEGMVQSSAAVQELSKIAQDMRQVMDGLR